MEIIQLLIASVALLIGVWNYLEIRTASEKKEYKDKRYLYGLCLDESKAMLLKMHIEIEELIVKSSYYDSTQSYVGSHGFNEAHKEYLIHLREIQKL
ncbi:hypothetical protein, partial [Vibrio genomosp. F10]|uniref:hypothetical protein n=1 Tax=Vibrio genomosp. F10 TaxID=723171 RepID=UPI0011127CF1